MTDEREHWYEEDAGPIVRLYAVTRGRGRTQRPELDLTTLLVDAGAGTRLRRTDPEYAAIVELCRTPMAVAEVSAHLGLPLNLAKVLIGDLLDEGRLVARAPQQHTTGQADVEVLRAVLAGIRRVDS
ncbi:hypothetical protein NN3_53050 [Nocardia neocaledoniensis NBRC 108232]|uniref:Uncharacterized protein DUF742 n=1 Tax=Nocardia neocaledoniensis TaxID=236511 RepID=A0A317N988_9NOCA|nr:DUF742 domain-containing protein [Nocardia neocaledoniensis]PWV70158.1 uncharacterized protein DUF742 [Nocardia neocaledoniensis]GEM34298.1 hypothetical protein NN3_53050 [Nocardia neocaledoniensis NBRC 108232]